VPIPTSFAARCGAALAACLLAACSSVGQYSNAVFNQPLPGAAAGDAGADAAPAGLPAGAPTAGTTGPGLRTTFRVDGARGNPRVLMFLALSGGGSRASYLAAATMHALQDIGLLGEVDVISAVSGGSLAAAYYVASRDGVLHDAALAERLRAAGSALPAPLQPGWGATLRCEAALDDAQTDALRRLLADERAVMRLVDLCSASRYPPWDRASTLAAMKRNYVARYLANLMWLPNPARYWFSSFDRSDIMVDTLAGSLLHRRAGGWPFGEALRMRDLNPERPYLLIHATNATRQVDPDGRSDAFPFGSIFTFTQEDFAERLHSDVGAFSLPRAVMASSAFPLAFATMTLEDFRDRARQRAGAPPPNRDRRFLHLIDGGNADNLGLRSIKRALLELWADGRLDDYDSIIVLQVDAFTTPGGTGRHKPDPRGLLDLLLDTNVSDAVDSLLQANRDRMLEDFDAGVLRFERECELTKSSVRHLPPALCERLEARGRPWPEAQRRPVDLRDRMVFFHFGFADVVTGPGDETGRKLKRELDLIGTSFTIDDDERVLVQSFDNDGYEFRSRHAPTRLIEQAVQRVIQPDHPCIAQLLALVQADGQAAPGEARRQRNLDARRVCAQADRQR